VSEHSGLLIASFEYGVEHYSFDDLIDISNKSNPEIGEWPGANYSLVQLLMNFKQVETQRYIAAVSQPIWIGDEILFVAPTNDNRVTVWKVDKHGKGLEQFLPDLSGNLFAPRLSPAGDQIAFLGYKSWRNAHYAEILVLDLNTLEVEPILVFQKPFYSERLFISGLDWSPDGKYIGFSSNDEGDSDVYIYSIMDGSLTNITSELEGDAVFPKWLVP
jgi:Tol biopolymer transport system component